MNNFIFLVVHIAFLAVFSMIALRFGKGALNAWLCIMAISMNLFVFKQIRICGLEVTSTDCIAVGYMLGLNLMQEFFGKGAARRHVLLAFFCATGFFIISQFILFYTPSVHDESHYHYQQICGGLGRILVASFVSFAVMQLLDIRFFGWLKEKFMGKWLPLRILFSLSISQILDTFIFSFLGLWGTVENIWDVILLSLCLKCIVVNITVPFSALANKFGRPLPQHWHL